ncbi:hypothetical protein TVAG_473380 [Trichomonas vaginalis G3]|uniref:Uncharacterized protein n=1 Tax=Trichomonas vaginalis (strain ATCC PRA-98 / G3) TaxID=412133 RepID=A2EUF5_TRIV3|nr:hypothetical protein TVAGG3_0317200 [Trichomonas vaginalis G3]EAY03714.1 hypothetical protein TVAG_473380 [Trichomonas vaginalis G3]KAI5529022.1 hypothetical protein TVAGG3_0317200 [Trichomonas vaginalis G3]|eukprot:XP_001315937.1 hypothetical protein [Trichomonas vaginalis G3]
MDQKKQIYVAVPAFKVSGDAMDDAVLDAFAESMEIDVQKVKVLENNQNFFVFSDEINMDLATASKQIENSRNLLVNYDKSVHYITKLIRRYDTTRTKCIDVNQEVTALKTKNEELKQKLLELQKENAKRAEAVKKVEDNIRILAQKSQK